MSSPEVAGARPMAGSRVVDGALAALRAGSMVVVAGPGDGGGLVMAARHATPAAVNFMATHARGLICVPMHRRRLDDQAIEPMGGRAAGPERAALHVGVDLRGQAGGIAASERAATIRALADPASVAGRFVRPGHVFPLGCRAGGVVAGAGHAEAAVELVGVAGAGEAAVTCEIVGRDGEPMRSAELRYFADRHELPFVTLGELREQLTRPLVERVAVASVPLEHGAFKFVGYREVDTDREHLAAVHGRIRGQSQVLASVHSQCLTGDVLGSTRCDCGDRLERALVTVAAEGAGVVIYLRGGKDGGTGWLEQLRSHRRRQVVARDREVAGAILADLGAGSVKFLTRGHACT